MEVEIRWENGRRTHFVHGLPRTEMDLAELNRVKAHIELLNLLDDIHRAVNPHASCPECGGGWSRVPGSKDWVPDHDLDCSQFQ